MIAMECGLGTPGEDASDTIDTTSKKKKTRGLWFRESISAR